MVLLLLLAVFGPMLIEAARASRNEHAQRARGGVEPAGDVYSVMRVAYPAAFLAMITEGVIRGWPSAATMAAGALIFGAAKALKWWAITALGPAWTFRVIVLPGAPLVTSGPYRFVRHPNYLGVALELIAVWVMSGARVSGPIATSAFGLLILWRITVERRALDAILRRD